MSYSKTSMIRRIRGRLGLRAWSDICTEAMDTTETGLDVADTTKWAVGDVVEFQDDGEQCLVTALASATTLTVVRGYLSDTEATGSTHSISARIEKAGPAPYTRIAEAVSSAINELWPHVYAKVTQDITPSTTSYGYYSATATFEWLVEGGVIQEDTSGNYICLYGGIRSDYPIDLLQNVPSGVPLSGSTGKFFYIPNHYNFTNTIRVTGIRRLTDTVTTGSYDDLTDGVEVSCIISTALADLLESPDIARLLARDNAMYDTTVVPGRSTGVADVWRRKGMRFRHQWEESLRRDLPLMKTYRQVRSV